MPGDYTRLSFDPAEDYSRPRAEQGRMLRDAYLNELADGLDHRLRALALDVLGPCTAPLDLDTGGAPTSTGFRIEATADGTSFTIGLGRLYLHGLALDNNGKVGPQALQPPQPLHVEPGLQDLRAAAPVRYTDQPYLRSVPELTPGRRVVYVEAWEREVTAVERPDLIDPAIGVETDARVQTVWQVKVLPDPADDVDCGTPDADVPGWAAATAPSAGRLSTRGVAVPASSDPCSVPPDADYLGWENRLYRVEVHGGGTLAQAGFKWSRDNASVAAAVLGVDDTRTVLTVSRTGRDDVQRIREGAWVEVLDETRELSGTPGFLARVVTVDRVDDPTQQVTLSAALPADFDPTDASLRTRLRQWDQGGAAVGADGTVPVSAATGGLVLEDGVRITFADDPAGGTLRTGDHWTFTARSADGKVEELDQAPPQGPHRFYGRLAVIDLPNEVADCRGAWPPACSECGDCTVCVTPESHADGILTVQQAVDRVRRTGGRVCLAVGQYELDEPVLLDAAQGVTLSGHGWLTVLRHRGVGPALVLLGCRGVTVSDLAVLCDPPILREPDGGGGAEGGGAEGGDGGGGPFTATGIALTRSTGVDLLRCAVVRTSLLRNGGPQILRALISGRGVVGDRSPLGGEAVMTAIALSGTVVGLAVRDCALLADLAIAPPFQPDQRSTDGRRQFDGGRFLLLAGFELADSLVYGVEGGLLLDERVQLALGATLHDCLIVGDGGAAVTWQATPMNASLTIRDCRIDGGGAGIELASPDSEIRHCRITARAAADFAPAGGRDAEQPPPRLDGTGIALTAPRLAGVLSAVTVTGCTLATAAPAVALQLAQQDVVIADNRLDGGTGGVIMRPGSSGTRVVVRGNEVTRTERPDFRFDPGQEMVGVWLTGVTDGEVRGNRIHDLYPVPAIDPERLDIVAVALQECRSVTVADNTLDVPLPAGSTARLVAGVVGMSSSGRIDVLDNVITSGGRPDQADGGGPALSAMLFSLGRTHIDTALFEVPAPREPLDPEADAATVFAHMGSTGWYAEQEEGLAWVTAARVFAPDTTVLTAATIRGNRIEADGDSIAVQSILNGPLLLNDNLVRRSDQHTGEANQRTLLNASANSMVVSANHLETKALTAVQLDVPVNRMAVTGNVVKGAFLVNGQGLPAPWAAINVVM
ncbi:DUF6519 domain-containing protein [Kitasatospora sp. NPDC097691]|uniref:DUF6519 domain-containing protein n=1 Tax=Kitasatospora sp. NPDC097691 TaxID=3157231 RepID=UPI003318B94C